MKHQNCNSRKLSCNNNIILGFDYHCLGRWTSTALGSKLSLYALHDHCKVTYLGVLFSPLLPLFSMIVTTPSWVAMARFWQSSQAFGLGYSIGRYFF